MLETVMRVVMGILMRLARLDDFRMMQLVLPLASFFSCECLTSHPRASVTARFACDSHTAATVRSSNGFTSSIRSTQPYLVSRPTRHLSRDLTP